MADLSISPGSVVLSSGGQKLHGKAGAAINAGQTVYLDSTTSTLKLTVGTDATKLPCVGMATNSAGIGQELQYSPLDPNLTIGAHGLGNGIPMYLSANAGMVCPASDLGTGNHTTVIFVTNTSTTVSLGIVGGVGAHA